MIDYLDRGNAEEFNKTKERTRTATANHLYAYLENLVMVACDQRCVGARGVKFVNGGIRYAPQSCESFKYSIVDSLRSFGALIL